MDAIIQFATMHKYLEKSHKSLKRDFRKPLISSLQLPPKQMCHIYCILCITAVMLLNSSNQRMKNLAVILNQHFPFMCLININIYKNKGRPSGTESLGTITFHTFKFHTYLRAPWPLLEIMLVASLVEQIKKKCNAFPLSMLYACCVMIPILF